MRVGLNWGMEVPWYIGVTANSCGYSISGIFYVDKEPCHDYGPGYDKGDWIGCGIHLATRQLFYTKIGNF